MTLKTGRELNNPQFAVIIELARSLNVYLSIFKKAKDGKDIINKEQNSKWTSFVSDYLKDIDEMW